ncbi:carboxylate-amine ligase [Actinopolyspora biskrensis]|uniref:Putative glutamate--cysteine ligase 2 n=1 Tax=Actinopolyspora biskrensis TaxID=1470178 RepID=A0A852YSK3_9ACTN|nr:glutamate--cysteine ligase [Actinopolyspora biskrensis]NYH77691.1 carboxylate-amine ligase [Actinopolyspora biskrensis]
MERNTLAGSDAVAEKRTLGVEEEFHLVDSTTGKPSDSGPQMAHERSGVTGPGQVDPELLSSQVELSTPVCSDLGELRAALTRLRNDLVDTADRRGERLVASGTYPDSYRSLITPKQRYEEMVARFGVVAREQVVCGCHIHVGVNDPDLAVAVMNRARPWMATLLALSANSPFWRGEDTNYDSYRAQIWWQWPSSGMPGVCGSYEEYVESTQHLVDVGVLQDRGMLYWDIRPSEHLSTVEFRICDVVPRAEQTVMLAGLARALTARCVAEERDGIPLPRTTPELECAARWRAARSGLSGDLVDPVAARAHPAAKQVHRMLDYLDPTLREHGDREAVREQVTHLLHTGTNASMQRAAFQSRNSLRDVLEAATVTTTEG